jgi:transposase
MHPGIKPLTSLALVYDFEPVTRYGSARGVAAYVGFAPAEPSSAGKQRCFWISKGGSRLLRYLLVKAAHTAAGAMRG